MEYQLMETILLAGLLASCDSRPLAGKAQNLESGETQTAACYRYATGGDSIRMQLCLADSGIKGTLLIDHSGQ